MSWESDPAGNDTSRDYGRYVLPGIIGVVCLMLAGVWWAGREMPVDQTRARIQSIRISYNRMDNASQTKALETITQLRQRILDGESFSKLANEHSDYGPTTGRGGNWGWIYSRDLLSEMGTFVWNGPVNELSPIIQGDTAYHLIYILDRKFSDAELHEIKMNRRPREEEASESSP